MPKSQKSIAESQIAALKQAFPTIEETLLRRVHKSATLGGELEQCGSFESWIERFKFGTVVLNENDYTEALTHGLRLAPRLAATDYGTRRVRDLGQLWTDAARGFLGELALAKFVEQRFGIQILPDYSLGNVEDYLLSDIKAIRRSDGEQITPKLRVSFKTTKFNGLWLDLPGAQAEHSDVFVLLKLGIEQDHFVAFLKSISLFRDKLLPKAVQLGALRQKESDELWDTLPVFRNIPCYVAGFLDGDLHNRSTLSKYRESHTRQGDFKHYVICGYHGWIRHGVAEALPDGLDKTKFAFELIERFSSVPHFVVNAGSLKYSQSDWAELLGKLVE